MKAHRSSFFVATFAALALAGCSHGGSAAGGDVAIVNGEAISTDEFYRYMERKPVVQVAVTQQVQPGQAAEMRVTQPIGFQALRDLINRRILLDVARDDKVMPTDAQIGHELEFQRGRQPDFMNRLTSQGMTLDDIKRDLTIDLAKENILTKGIVVSPADADAYIKGHPDQFMNPETARLIVVVVKDMAGEQQVDKDLAAGKAFGAVAEQYSIDPSVRQTQGIVSIANVAQLPPAFQDLLSKTPEGKATPWQTDQKGFVKIYVDKKTKASPMKIDDNQKEFVRRQLALQRGGSASDLPKRLVDKLRSSKITVNPPDLKALWDAAYNELMKADTPTASATAAPGAAPTAAPGAASTTPGAAPTTAGAAPTSAPTTAGH